MRANDSDNTPIIDEYISTIMPHLLLLTPSSILGVRSTINPYKNGAGKYPNKLQKKLATELAIAHSFEGTEFSKMPVRLGMIKPPKNKTNQRNIITPSILFIKGTGKHDALAQRDTKKHKYKAFLLVQPPTHVVVTYPPTNTPIVGPVIDAPLYKMKTSSLLAPMTTYIQYVIQY